MVISQNINRKPVKHTQEERMSKSNPSRAPKQLGDFGEALVNYDFIRKGYQVAVVDHVGADLICIKKESEKRYKRYAVSVKTRWFKPGSTESKMFNIENNHLEKLEDFSEWFNLEPLFSLLVCLSDSQKLVLFTLKVSDIGKICNKTQSGYSLKFSDKYIEQLKNDPRVSVSSWENEVIGEDIFRLPDDSE